jgi:hypothetical protein
MPNMHGFELCEKILELDVNIRVCFMSALEVKLMGIVYFWLPCPWDNT